MLRFVAVPGSFFSELYRMVYELELFLANTSGKAPFFGICYPHYVPFGSHENSHILNDNFKINLFVFFRDDKLDIMLETEGFCNHDYYRNVKYNKQELFQWIQSIKDSKIVNFGHVKKTDKGIVMCRAFVNEKYFVKPVNNIYLMNFKGEQVLKMANQ